MTVPSPQSAEALLTELDAAGARVRREGDPAPSAFLLTLGLASAGFLLAQPVAGTERGVAAAALPLALAVVGAALGLLAGRRTTRHGFGRRFGLAMGVWSAVFAVALALGRATEELAWSWAWWAPMAVLATLPCLVGAWRELPR